MVRGAALRTIRSVWWALVGNGMFAEMDDAFPNSIHTVDALRTLYKQPSALVSGKKKPQLDELSAKFVRASPFLLLGTASGEGELEVSPRGGPVGWVKVLDDTRLLIPDLNGNNLVDSMTNILANPYVSLLFVHPGKDETLRANGRACITIDEGLLGLCVEPTADGRAPKLPKAAIGVHIIDVFIHCAKAFRRGGVWNPESWPALENVDAVDILRCQLSIDLPKEQVLTSFELAYAEELSADWQSAT